MYVAQLEGHHNANDLLKLPSGIDRKEAVDIARGMMLLRKRQLDSDASYFILSEKRDIPKPYIDGRKILDDYFKEVEQHARYAVNPEDFDTFLKELREEDIEQLETQLQETVMEWLEHTPSPFVLFETVEEEVYGFSKEEDRFIYDYRTLYNRPTISEGHAEDMKVDLGKQRIWLSRSPEDEIQDWGLHDVHVEEFIPGDGWVTILSYNAYRG